MIDLLICSIIIIIIIINENETMTAFAGKIMAYDAKHYRLLLVSPLQSYTVSFHFFSGVYFSCWLPSFFLTYFGLLVWTLQGDLGWRFKPMHDVDISEAMETQTKLFFKCSFAG